MSDLLSANSVERHSLPVSILARTAGILWVAIGLYGVWSPLALAFVIRAFGHARDESSIPAQLFITSYLAVCLAVRFVRGNARGVVVVFCVCSFCGLLSAATEFDFRDPYERLRWWVTSLVGAPIAPLRNPPPAGPVPWVILVLAAIAAGCAIVGGPGYMRYRLQRVAQAKARNRRGSLVPWILPIAVLLIPVALNLIAYYNILSERQFDVMFEGALCLAVLAYLPMQIFTLIRRSSSTDRLLSAAPMLITLPRLCVWASTGFSRFVIVAVGILAIVALSYLVFIWRSSIPADAGFVASE